MNFVNNGQEFLSYNDVLLQPQASDLNSRYDPRIDLSVRLTSNVNSILQLPVISANMDTVTESAMAEVMGMYGGLGIFHRYYSDTESELKDYTRMQACPQVGFSIGILTRMEHIENCVQTIRTAYKDTPFIYICLDVAHGHMKQALEKVEAVRDLISKNSWQDVEIIAGNVATYEGSRDLIQAGVGCIKCGVGNGSHCTTRLVAGHGVPQLSAIEECKKAINESPRFVGLIADGGIKHIADIVKALAVGADAVMIGNMFAGTIESPGQVYQSPEGKKFKMYRGQSSLSFMNDNGKTGRAAEGEMSFVPFKGSMTNILSEIEGGIRSGMTYSGASNIQELRQKARFIRITGNGWVESTPHGI